MIFSCTSGQNNSEITSLFSTLRKRFRWPVNLPNRTGSISDTLSSPQYKLGTVRIRSRRHTPASQLLHQSRCNNRGDQMLPISTNDCFEQLAKSKREEDSNGAPIRFHRYLAVQTELLHVEDDSLLKSLNIVKVHVNILSTIIFIPSNYSSSMPSCLHF